MNSLRQRGFKFGHKSSKLTATLRDMRATFLSKKEADALSASRKLLLRLNGAKPPTFG